MNRNQALEALLRGEKVVSYFGFEYQLTKHGIECSNSMEKEYTMLGMSDSATYSLLPAPGNPHAVGSMEWAKFEFERGRTVVSPAGRYYDRENSWDDLLIRVSDLTGFWTLENNPVESSQSSPKASEPSPAESSNTTPELEQESACRE